MKAQPQPNFTIKAQDGRYKVFDRNQHYRGSYATAAAAREWIDLQRTVLRITLPIERPKAQTN